ncbi:glycosyl transferase [Ramlibacter henchirensis]|uniref:Glycosyl transferase n=1 Tax=Ramlibacter henchirensis TaxID=204072 RepID=A0A4Z0C3X7_9BURK|nr:glycosyltransferase [Ramlibacter henchirensis]TFZ05168.1 glycosyl transferase [Ramlibacter henchirensis]
MLALLILCAFVSAVACASLVRYGRRSARRYAIDMPQRFHTGHVPRLGGVAMMLACTAGWIWMGVAERYLSIPIGIDFAPELALAWWIVVLIPVLGGVAEDITHRLGARWRLALSAAAGVAAVWLLGVQVPSLGLPALDALWTQYPWPSFLLAAFAVAGLPHAFNLIDGYNGLAGIVATICCLAVAHVALQLGDRQLAAIMLVLAGATAGFLLWNYPRGLIFAGDGGAYLWGVVIAVAAIQLVQRHPQVSPWFPMLLLIYPVWETVFSIYRKAVRGQSPGVADALHFHQLIYRRIVRGVFDDHNEARRMLMRNNRTSPYLWGFTLLTVVPAVLFWRNTYVLIAFCLLFVVSYIYAYVSIVRFKVPRWLRR